MKIALAIGSVILTALLALGAVYAANAAQSIVLGILAVIAGRHAAVYINEEFLK